MFMYDDDDDEDNDREKSLGYIRMDNDKYLSYDKYF